MRAAFLSSIVVPVVLSGAGMLMAPEEPPSTTPGPVRHEVALAQAARAIVTSERAALITARAEWLEQLVQCESGGDPNAINPHDVDGTPSYGLLQFKPTTFSFYKQRYGIEGTLMDPKAQRAIVWRMFDDPSVVWEREFPACVRKLGPPPQQAAPYRVHATAISLALSFRSSVRDM